MASPRTQALAAEVARARWYHTIELPGGVVTPGEYDLRPLRQRLPLPASLKGRRCLDVGTRDGFWAFEMERRGTAEVVGIDVFDPARLDWPEPRPEFDAATRAELEARARTFEIAHGALDSRAERRDLSVYDLTPELAGMFDLAFLGTLLLHLRDPVRALIAVRSVLRAGGTLLLNEPVALSLTLAHPRRPVAALLRESGPFWSVPNVAGLRRRAEAAGFRIAAAGGPYAVPYGSAAAKPRIRRNASRTPLLDQLALRFGMPHVWLSLERVG